MLIDFGPLALLADAAKSGVVTNGSVTLESMRELPVDEYLFFVDRILPEVANARNSK